MSYVGIGEKELLKNWPFTSGLQAGTEKQDGRISNLIPEIKSLVSKKDLKGIK